MILAPPETLPQIQPNGHQILCVVACLLAERDALLIEVGRPPKQEGRIEYSRDQQKEGRQMGPVAYVGPEGEVVVRCDL